jgi:hypothetical protein
MRLPDHAANQVDEHKICIWSFSDVTGPVNEWQGLASPRGPLNDR